MKKIIISLIVIYLRTIILLFYLNKFLQKLDETAVSTFRMRHPSVNYEEKVINYDLIEWVKDIGESKKYGLVMVGKGGLSTSEHSQGYKPQHEELGLLGDILASSNSSTSSTLIIQHNANEAIISFKY